MPGVSSQSSRSRRFLKTLAAAEASSLAIHAKDWLEIPDGFGDAKAEMRLGDLYLYGWGVPEDYAETAKWYRLAADQGEPAAQAMLGSMYADGTGLPKDIVLAHLWWNLAVAGEKSDDLRSFYASRRGELERLMTSDQIAQAQRLARAWRPTVWPP